MAACCNLAAQRWIPWGLKCEHEQGRGPSGAFGRRPDLPTVSKSALSPHHIHFFTLCFARPRLFKPECGFVEASPGASVPAPAVKRRSARRRRCACRHSTCNRSPKRVEVGFFRPTTPAFGCVSVLSSRPEAATPREPPQSAHGDPWCSGMLCINAFLRSGDLSRRGLLVLVFARVCDRLRASSRPQRTLKSTLEHLTPDLGRGRESTVVNG